MLCINSSQLVTSLAIYIKTKYNTFTSALTSSWYNVISLNASQVNEFALREKKVVEEPERVFSIQNPNFIDPLPPSHPHPPQNPQPPNR